VQLIAQHPNGKVIVGVARTNATATHTLLELPSTLTWAGNVVSAYAATPSTVDTYYYHAHFDQQLIFTRRGLNPVAFDGTTFTAMTITGPAAPSDIDTGVSFKGRMYYVTGADGDIWYAGAGAFQGTLTSFPVGDNFLRGGVCQVLVPLTIDGGDGPDDMLCVISSNGEALVYAGDDPGSATDWALVGRFEIGRPCGKQCWAKIGSTTIVVTQHGPMDLQQVLSAGAGAMSAAISAKVDNGVMTRFDNRQTDYDAQLIFDADAKVLWWFSRRSAIGSVVGSFSLVSGMDTDTRQWFEVNGWSCSAWNVGVGGSATPTGGLQLEGASAAGLVNGKLALGSSLGRIHRPDAYRSAPGSVASDSVARQTDSILTADNIPVGHEFMTGYSSFADAGSTKTANSVRISQTAPDLDGTDTVLTDAYVFFVPNWDDVQRRPFSNPWTALDAIQAGYANRLRWYRIRTGSGRVLGMLYRTYNAGGCRYYGADVDFSVTDPTSGKN
jgi:hypothetical protein